MIYYILIALLIIYFLWLYFRSKNDFFSQSREVLADKRQLLIKILEDRKVSQISINTFLEAFDSLRDYPTLYKFDGATILADLETIKGLDASAMVHDYQYQRLRNKGFWFYLKGKLKADVNYGKNMRKIGITWLVAWSRVSSLILSTPIWMIIMACNGKLRRNKKYNCFNL